MPVIAQCSLIQGCVTLTQWMGGGQLFLRCEDESPHEVNFPLTVAELEGLRDMLDYALSTLYHQQEG
jgi:hypothetical protein